MLPMILKGASLPTNAQYVGGYTVSDVGTTSDITVSLTSLTGGVSSQPIQNDLVLIAFSTASTADRNLVVSGYTELQEYYANSTYDTNLVVAFKIMTSTPDTSITITGGSGSVDDGYSVYVSVWRNVHKTYPFAGISSSSATNTVSAYPPSLNPSVNNSTVVAIGAGAHADGPRTYFDSFLSNFLTSGSNDTNDSTIGGGYKVNTSGTLSPSQFVYLGTNSTIYSNVAVTLGLRPEAESAPYYVSNSVGRGTSSAFISLTTPTGIQDGDLLVCFAINSGGQTANLPSGFTEIVSTVGQIIGVKRASNESGNYVFSFSANTNFVCGILVYRKASFINAGTYNNVTGITGTALGIPAITSGIAIAFHLIMNSSSVSPASATGTQRVSNSSNTPTVFVYDQYVGFGTTGNMTISLFAGSVSWRSIQIVIG